ncbi:MAG TPA: SUMF1/EgtB/PvdO family nonheme iron enzyme [Thermoguttaceae bacterium]|nr:SUMF1/EgtB/PvdO family nonheme iron enzyme [Thermoguttaceae bacterium]
MAVLLDQFVETLSESGLMTADEVQAFLDGLGADERPETSEELAKLLFRHGKLTKFQAQCIYQGKTKGLVFDEYTVLDKIGQGGMGIVLKAQHRRMKRLVAVKMLPAAALKNKEAVSRFYREVEAAARLTHPNIVTAYDAREHAGTHYLVMEYVEGKDLAELVAERGPLPVGQAVNCVIQAAQGLEYAHKQGIIHRDIKPSNLLLDREGTVKILDMGLARIFEGDGATGSDRLTGSGQVMGTCDYMAPEQAEDTHGADHRADVYSLGCTLYRLLTGEKPYQGDTMIQILMAHRAAEIPSARDVRSDVPEAVDGVCRKMMAKKPEDRYQSMTEVLAALETCVAVKTPVPPPVADESSSDGALTSFLQNLPKGGVATKKKAARVAEDTFESHVEQNTSSNIWTKLVPAHRGQMWTYAGIAGGAAFLVVLLGVVFMLKTPEGTLVVEVNQPGAEIVVDDGKVTLTTPDDKEPVEIQVEGGQHTLSVTKGGFETHTDTFRIESGGREVFNVQLVPLAAPKAEGRKAKAAPSEPKPEIAAVKPLPPPDPAAWKAILPADAPAPAIAPFNAAQPKKHQEVWAGYLGMPVEQDVDLGDGVKVTVVLIPPGEFVMGSTAEEQARFLEEARAAADQWAIERIPTEGPQHRVRITRPFYLGKYEVTQAQWEAVMGSNPSRFTDDPSHPVEQVSWDDVQPFLAKLNESRKSQGMKFALPTEAQWEYACRAGTTTAWHCGNDEAKLQEYAWFNMNSGGKTHPVGELLANGFGLYDMLGNAWEWCADWYGAEYYAQSPADDPSGPSAGSHRVHRGGGWLYHARRCRSANRDYNSPDYRRDYLGFRLACETQLPWPQAADITSAPEGESRPPQSPQGSSDPTEAERDAGADIFMQDFDRNKDGKVSLDEKRNMPPKTFKRYDRNSDGMIDREEAREIDLARRRAAKMNAPDKPEAQ